jgi:tetratricopeptide (TPR) repeat protein
VPHRAGGVSRGFGLWRHGEAYLLAGCVEEAHQLAQRALSDARHRTSQDWEVQTLWLLGEIARRHDPSEVAPAETSYQEALTLVKMLGMRPWQAHSQNGLGRLYHQTGRLAQARSNLAAAVGLYRALAMTFWLPQAEAALAQVTQLRASEPVDRPTYATAVMCFQYDTGVWAPAARFHCVAD